MTSRFLNDASQFHLDMIFFNLVNLAIHDRILQTEEECNFKTVGISIASEIFSSSLDVNDPP